MGRALEVLLPKLWPGGAEKSDWLIINHQGKSQLESSYPRKLRTWNELGVRFLILRDNDGSDCRELKRRLVRLVPPGSPEHRIRIVCQELESWFLGDLAAVVKAYPGARRKPNFRQCERSDPDQATNAADLLKELTGTGVKVERAKSIAKHMTPALNRSHSFQVFCSTVAGWISA